MMASNIISRLLPARTGSPSVYETIRQHDELSDDSDLEERAAMAIDEENLGERFHDYELEEAFAQASDSQLVGQSTKVVGKEKKNKTQEGRRHKQQSMKKVPRPKWMHGSPRPEADEADDDVPASLLIEGGEEEEEEEEGENDTPAPPPPVTGLVNGELNIPTAGPSTNETRRRWEATRAQQPLHSDRTPSPSIPRRILKGPKGLGAADPKQVAMWRWANVDNLDVFLNDVYVYYLDKGFWSTVIGRALSLLKFGFVVGFTTFLTHCIDYHAVPSSRKLGDILVDKCMKKTSGGFTLILWVLSFFCIWKALSYLLDLRRLWNMHDFYLHLLRISDTEIQTISWQEVVRRLMELRDLNQATATNNNLHQKFLGNHSKQRMDAHDIANRLMRKENYLIALFNKDVLDLTLPIPFLRKRQLFSRTLQWNINNTIIDFVFNEKGQVRPIFLKDTHRRELSDTLKNRFIFAGCMNIFIAPFLVLYFLVLYFFKYFTEYQKNPGEIGSRQYNPLAEWKFREFNELWHLFQRRINMSYPFATRYVDQFPKDKTVQIAQFVAFLSGALAAVLALGSLLDPTLFLSFEITKDRTVLFYIGIFGAIWAVARGMVPEENLVFDPEFALGEVIEFTHYRPAHWEGRLHSDEVRKEFSSLYQMKVIIFLEEILSMITTPFVLWFSLPKCSDRIIDFFREFTVHVDGIGYVCSFAVFDFKKGGNVTTRFTRERGEELRDDYYSTKDNKMLSSYYGFMNNYALNPKTGVPYAQRSPKRAFHPPPSFHELTSPPLGPDMTGLGSRWERAQASGIRNAGVGHQSSHRTPRFGAVGGQQSPVTSILLDPHHQPSASGFRSMHRPGTQSRFRTARHPMENTTFNEDEEEDALPPTQSSDGAEVGDDSNLGESWKTNRAAEGLDDEEDDDEDPEVAGEKGAGVLGLIYQFQKAQAGGREGAGVNI